MPSSAARGPAELVEDFFRRESSRLTALLVRRFGLSRLDLVEDAVQFALLRALEKWRLGGAPADPAAWIYRAATNRVLNLLRHESTRHRLAPRLEEAGSGVVEPEDHVHLDSELSDSQLRMIFTCCHPELPVESQVALTLKLLCGLSAREIARLLMTTEDNVTKRIYRAKRRFADRAIRFEVPVGDPLEPRLEVVLATLYALFNEGYNSAHPDTLIRRELCGEAMRLTGQIVDHASLRHPAAKALLALMCFHAARFDARLDWGGAIVLLEDQDRSLWDGALIARGMELLSESAQGELVTRYHIEAAVAARHCAAESFEDTDWCAILGLYDRLLVLNPNGVYRLNRAIALSHVEGPRAGIEAVRSIEGLERLRERYHLVDAALGELHRRLGETERARRLFRSAAERTTSIPERFLLDRKIKECDAKRPAKDR